MVTREELRAKLWANDTFVDFDHGLNSAVQRLRDCLSDSAENPRWVETIPRRGYRFVGHVEWSEDCLPPFDGLPTAEITTQHTNSEDPARSAVEELAKGQGEGKLPAVNRPSAAFAIGVLLVILAGILTVKPVWDARSARPAFLIRSLAVLPLENLSGDSQQEYFADGMTDEVITMLAKNKALRVISRTSVMQYKNVHRPLREIAEELGVDGILEGSVGRTGNKVHVTAQLIHAASDTHVWAESYDRAVSDLYTIQSDIAQTIAMQVGVTASVPASPVRRISPEAHDAYLLGRYYWFAFDPEKSRQYFQKAINIQPDYAAAWSGLADAYLEPGVMGRARAEDLIGRGGEAAQRAVTLDDSLAEAHNSMAAVHFFYRWEWERAERESKRTVELNPNFAEGHHLRGYVLLALNRTEEALQEQKKSMELDPFARPWALAGALIRMRQFDAALNEARVRSEAQPENATLHVYLTRIIHEKWSLSVIVRMSDM